MRVYFFVVSAYHDADSVLLRREEYDKIKNIAITADEEGKGLLLI